MMKNKHSIETQLTSGITYLRNHRLIENSNFWFGISWNYVVSISIVVKSVAKISSNDEKQTHNWETIDKLIIWDVIELKINANSEFRIGFSWMYEMYCTIVSEILAKISSNDGNDLKNKHTIERQLTSWLSETSSS